MDPTDSDPDAQHSCFDTVTFCEGERGAGRSAQLQRAYATAVAVCHASCP
jgi:hypothetical protein